MHGDARRDAEHRLGAVGPGQDVGGQIEVPGADLGRLGGQAQRLLADFEAQVRGAALRHVERDAADPQRAAVFAADDLAAHADPADRAVRAVDAVLDVELRARGDATVERGTQARHVVGMGGASQILAGKRLADVAAEARLAFRRCGQRAALQVDLPYAEAAGLGGEAQARLALPLGTQAVGTFGEQGGVVALQPGQALALQRDVNLACEEIGESAIAVPYRGQQQAVPERLAGLAVVADVDFDALHRGDGRANACHRRRVGLRPLQEAAVAADDLLPRVAGEAAERIVGEDHRVVVRAGVGDDHRHPRGAHRGCERVGSGGDALEFGLDAVAVACQVVRLIWRPGGALGAVVHAPLSLAVSPALHRPFRE